MNRPTAVITDYDYADVALERAILGTAGIPVRDYHVVRPEEVIAVARQAQAIIIQYARINRDVIENLENCRIIIKYGVGVDNVDVAAATEKGIYVCNVPDYGVDEVSNHAIALLFALLRKLPQAAAALRSGIWSGAPVEPLHRLQGATLGLLGFGRIPQMVAQKMAGFGVRLIAYDPYCGPDVFEACPARPVTLAELARQSDYLSIHCPLNSETYHLVDAAFLNQMKPQAVIINTARGPIIDEAALIKALISGKIAGAGLDVFEQEPLAADNPLLALENVVATPHYAGYSEESRVDLRTKVAREVVNVLAGNRPFNLVNRTLLGG